MLAAETFAAPPPRAATTSQNDAQLLLERARHGEIDAVREMLAEHRDSMFGLAWGYLQNREDALEACQEALRKALSAAHRYDPKLPLGAWLTRILRNVCLDRLRRRKYRRHASIEERREWGAPDPRSPRPDPEENLMNRELRDELRRAIRTLREEEREAIILRDVLDWPYARIEAFLDISHGTLASLIHRARARLRERLDHFHSKLPGGRS